MLLLAWAAAITCWTTAFGLEIGIALALESAAIVAFGFILTRIEFREARGGRERYLPALTRSRYRWLRGPGNVGVRIYGMLTPLHVGTYGGILLKLVYLILGIGMATLVATGAQIMLARRRDQGRASTKWERVWDGVVWGQPVALLLAALGVLLAGAPPLPLYWLATFAILVASPFVGHTRTPYV